MNGLANARVLVTRLRTQSSELARLVEAEGGTAVLMPVLEVAPPLDATPLQEAKAHLDRYDWMVFTSRNGVLALCDAPMPASLKLAAVGPATATELARVARAPDWTPPDFGADALAETLPIRPGERVLLAQGDLARPDLAKRLRARGARVEVVQAYRTVANPEIELPKARPDLISFASSSAVLATHERLCAANQLVWLKETPLVVIGPTTADTVMALGLPVAERARASTVPALVEALVRCWRARDV